MKKMLAFFTIIFSFVFAACSSDENDYWGDVTTPSQRDTIVVVDTVIVNDTVVIDDTLIIRTPIWVDVIDGDTVMRDSDGEIIKGVRPDKFIATITCQDTVVVSADKPWTLSSYQENPQTPLVDYIIGVSTWVYNHRTLSAKDSIRGEFRGRILPLYPGAKRAHEVEEFEEVVTDTTTSRDVHYVLYIRDNVMNHAPQVQGTTTSTAEVKKLFAHKAFRANATVNGSNIAVICDNTATFHKTNDIVVSYLVTNNFIIDIPEYISVRAKGNTYFFEGSTATVEGKNVTVSFSNRVIADIIFDNTNYKDDKDVPQCEITVKSIKFGENTAIITFVHDNETVTAIVPVRYNYVAKYELVGNPTHDIWNSVTGNGTSFAITCNNHVVVKEIWADGSEGETFELPYVSTNEWSVDNTTIVVENKNSIIGVREEIVDGSVTIGLSALNFSHTMHAESVSKGTFTLKPAPCEAVSRYITVVDENTAIVEIYHDNQKIGEHELPIKVTEINIIPGHITGGNISDSYTDQYSVRVTWVIIRSTLNGKINISSKLENEKTFSHEEYDKLGILTNADKLTYCYGQNGGKQLGTFEAIKMDSQNESFLIFYKDWYKVVMYTLGTAEEKLANTYRNPDRGSLYKIVLKGVTLWTFDGINFYKGSED